MLVSARFLCESTGVSADPFSDILTITNAEAILTGEFSAGGAWAIRFPASDKVKFSTVVKGGCWISLEGEAEPIRCETGDVGLLAVPRSLVLASDLSVEPVDAFSLFSGAGRTKAKLDGQDFTYIGGHVKLDPARAATPGTCSAALDSYPGGIEAGGQLPVAARPAGRREHRRVARCGSSVSATDSASVHSDFACSSQNA